MKNKDVKNKQESDLLKLLFEKQKALRLFRFGVAGGKAKNVKEGRNLRKDISRIMTELNTRKENE